METDFKKCRDVPTYRLDLGRHFFADLNFDGFRGLQHHLIVTVIILDI
jgi:hypothetical protein